MKNRKGTPDIMDELMITGTATVTQEQESNKAMKQENQSSNTANSSANNNASFNASNKTIINAGKEKVTFNLSADAIEILEEAWIKLRRKFKGEQRITKTLIVEKAIEIALEDLETKSELSDLFMRLKN